MTQNKLFVIIGTIFLFIQGYTQTNNFSLSDYQLPYLKRQKLEFYIDIAGNDYHNIVDSRYSKISTHSYASDINIDYNLYINDYAKQTQMNFGMNSSTDFYNRSGDDYYSGSDLTNYNVQPSLYFSRINRKYKDNGSFFEFDQYFNYDFQHYYFDAEQDMFPDDNFEEFHMNDILIQFPIKLGKGRIEQVQDARHAHYITTELRENQRFEKEFTDYEMYKLAELISELKNKRILDARIKEKYEIKVIDSALTKNNNVSETDAIYFTTLADIWRFGNNPVRYSGTRIAAAIYPGYNFNSYSWNRMNALMLIGGVEFSHERPLSLTWQNSINIYGYAGILNGKLTHLKYTDEVTIRIPEVQFSYQQMIGYYPNTRTDLAFSYGGQFIKYFDKTNYGDQIAGIDGFGVMGFTDLSINYYLSPRFRMNFTASVFYIWQDSNSDSEVFNTIDIIDQATLDIYYDYATPFKIKEFMNSFKFSIVYNIF